MNEYDALENAAWKEIESLQDKIEELESGIATMGYDECERLQDENIKLRGALRFYANVENYISGPYNPAISVDNGWVARAALG